MADRPPRRVVSVALDDYQTHLRVHEARGPAAAPVLMLHGIQSHPGWFVGSAEALAAAGHPVWQFQRRGSGTCTRERGHARSPRQLLADLDAAVDIVLAESGADRLHLVGISWGGKYAACYALDARRGRRIESLTLIAPGIASRVDISWTRKIAVGLCALAAPRRTFAIPLNDSALFTDNPVRREYIRNDPHALKRATASFLLTSRRMDRLLARASDGAIRPRMNLLLADRDRIIYNDATRAVASRLAGGGLNVVEFAGAHTLEFELDTAVVFQAMVDAVK